MASGLGWLMEGISAQEIVTGVLGQFPDIRGVTICAQTGVWFARIWQF